MPVGETATTVMNLVAALATTRATVAAAATVTTTYSTLLLEGWRHRLASISKNFAEARSPLAGLHCEEGKSSALVACAATAANAVNISLRGISQVVIYDLLEVFDIKASRGDVVGDN